MKKFRIKLGITFHLIPSLIPSLNFLFIPSSPPWLAAVIAADRCAGSAALLQAEEAGI